MNTNTVRSKVSHSALLALAAAALLGSACAGDFGDEAGFEEEEVASTSSALINISVLDQINTCDSLAIKLVGDSSNRFSLKPTNGADRFTAQLYSGLHLFCSVGVKFNVPQGYRAKIRLGTTMGVWGTNQTNNAEFVNQTGFTFNRRPVSQADTTFGPSIEEAQFLPKNSGGDLDLQVDQNDDPNDQLKTSCGQQNVWFYVRPRLGSPATVVLQLIAASFKLEAC